MENFLYAEFLCEPISLQVYASVKSVSLSCVSAGKKNISKSRRVQEKRVNRGLSSADNKYNNYVKCLQAEYAREIQKT